VENMPGRFLCSFSFARPKENEPKEKDAPRKFLTSRASPSADDFVRPASLRACTTKSFTASIDGTKFSQGVLMLLCVAKPIPAKAGTGGVRSGNESIEGLKFRRKCRTTSRHARASCTEISGICGSNQPLLHLSRQTRMNPAKRDEAIP